MEFSCAKCPGLVLRSQGEKKIHKSYHKALANRQEVVKGEGGWHGKVEGCQEEKMGDQEAGGGEEAGGHDQEAGGRGQEAGGHGHEAGGYGQEAGGRGQEAGGHGQEAGGYGQEAGGRGQETGGHGQDAGEHGKEDRGRGHEAGVGGQEAGAGGGGHIKQVKQDGVPDIGGEKANQSCSRKRKVLLLLCNAHTTPQRINLFLLYALLF